MSEYSEIIGQKAMQGVAGLASVRNLRKNLEQQLTNAQSTVARLQELLSLLDRNPEVNRIMELLGRSY